MSCSKNQISKFTLLEMVPNEGQFGSFGICHRLYCFIMKTLAAQALKTVTLGPPVPRPQNQQQRIAVAMDSQSRASGKGEEDSESVASIDIEDMTSPLLDAVQNGRYRDQWEIKVEIMDDCKRKAPRKMVSIKDEPEVINLSNKRRKTMWEKQKSESLERELRPLRSILKVGSTLCDPSC